MSIFSAATEPTEGNIYWAGQSNISEIFSYRMCGHVKSLSGHGRTGSNWLTPQRDTMSNQIPIDNINCTPSQLFNRFQLSQLVIYYKSVKVILNMIAELNSTMD